MARLLIFLVIIVSASCVIEDPFALPPLPKTVHIDPAFTEQERAYILDKIVMLNRELGALIGHDILIVGEALDDSNGFDSDGSDMGDDVHGIYRLSRDSEAYRNLSSLSKRDFGGYATLQDVIMIRNLDRVQEMESEVADIEAVSGWEDDEALVKRHQQLIGSLEYVRWGFRKVIAHELGHHIGLSHNPREDTLMHPGQDSYESIQPGDKEAFCFVRGCAYP